MRVLQQREIDRVGGLHPIPVDVRVVAATNRNLRDLVARGQFREDLYYRLQGMTLAVPPLRERRDEIPALVERFCAESLAEGHTAVRGLTTDALDAVFRHSWPGNVRELRNAIMRAAVLSTGEWIEAVHLVGLVPGPTAVVAGNPPSGGGAPGAPTSLPGSAPAGYLVTPEAAVPSAVSTAPARVLDSTEPTPPLPGEGQHLDRSRRLLALIASHGEIAVEDHVRDAKVSPRTALRDLSILIRQRRIERVGIRRGARYRLANSLTVHPSAPSVQIETVT